MVMTNAAVSLSQSAEFLAKRHSPRITNLGVRRDSVELSVYPPKWGAGLAMWTAFPAHDGTVVVILPPEATGPSPALFKQISARNPFLQGLSMPPQPLVALWADAESRELIKALRYVSYAGASLDPVVGDEIAQSTMVVPLIASIDGGLRFSIQPLDRMLWRSVLYVPEAPHRFVRWEGSAVAGDGEEDLFELVFDRPADGKPSLFQGAFWNEQVAAGNDSLPQSELYAPVKDSDGSTRWVIRARTDDLIKLSFLAKFHAVDIEQRILRHSAVKHVVVGGEGRSVPYVLIEVNAEALKEKTEAKLLDEIYDEAVAPGNAKDTEEIRIPRETVALGSRDKPFRVSMKQVVLRREIEKEYSEEIEKLYRKVEGKRANGCKNGDT